MGKCVFLLGNLHSYYSCQRPKGQRTLSTLVLLMARNAMGTCSDVIVWPLWLRLTTVTYYIFNLFQLYCWISDLSSQPPEHARARLCQDTTLASGERLSVSMTSEGRNDGEGRRHINSENGCLYRRHELQWLMIGYDEEIALQTLDASGNTNKCVVSSRVLIALMYDNGNNLCVEKK